MTKRISCKVIRSFPLTKVINPSIHSDQLKNIHFDRDYAVVVNVRGQSRCTSAVGQAKPTGNSLTYKHPLDISKAALDYRMTGQTRLPEVSVGQVLDCYV